MTQPALNKLNKKDIKEIMQQRKFATRATVGKTVSVLVEEVSEEVCFSDNTGQKLYNFKGEPVNKKILYCNANSEIAMNKIKNRQLLKRGLFEEKTGDFYNADKSYRYYLERVQFKVSILSNYNSYNLITKGSEISGEVQHIFKGEFNFLTLDSSTIRLLEPK